MRPLSLVGAVVGGSMGGMQALSLAANWPERAERVLVVASTSRHSAQNIVMDIGNYNVVFIFDFAQLDR